MYKEIKKKNKKKGFTLVELLIAVLIIGVIAGISMPMYFRAVEKSRASESLHVLGTLAKAQQRHKLQSNEYTDTIDELDITLKDYSTGTNATGSEFETEFFDFELGEGVATAARKDNSGEDYTLSVDYATGKITCSAQGNSSICERIGLNTANSTPSANNNSNYVDSVREYCQSTNANYTNGSIGCNAIMESCSTNNLSEDDCRELVISNAFEEVRFYCNASFLGTEWCNSTISNCKENNLSDQACLETIWDYECSLGWC